MHLKHALHIRLPAIQAPPTHNTMTATTSTRLYDQACIAAEKARALRDKANQTRFNASRLSVPDELYWYNNNTNWDSLSRKEFRDIMIRMESITAQHYEDFGNAYPNRSAAIRKFWADEWDCEYLPESGEWWDLSSNERIESETEKKAKRAEKKAQAKAEKMEKKAAKKAKKAQSKVKNDEEDEHYVQCQSQSHPEQSQTQDFYDYDSWYDAEEEAYAEAYAKARAEQEAKEQQEQREAEAYLAQHATRITCQPVFYFEELTDVQGDPDWRAYIYYDERIRRYVFKGTRRSVLNYNKKKTLYPEVKLCFRSSGELASFLCSSTDNTMNITMFAMASATVRDSTFAELSALPARGNKTELFGYDQTRPRYSTFVNYLRTLRDVDVSHSTFAAF